jgi:hypothetical protein
MRRCDYSVGLLVLSSVLASPARADLFTFSTGDPNSLIATASRPSSAGKIEIESADDFIASSSVSINHATFTGLLTSGATTANIGQVIVEIYRVFPKDSDIGGTSGPPTFSTPEVPTRVNSPSDVAFDLRDSGLGTLSFTTSVLSQSFTTLNSVLNGIYPKPNQTTGGDGPVTGIEVLFDITFSSPFLLPADHYFFVPQVEVMLPDGEFLWLSAPRPIVAPGTPFAPDLQSWIRDESLAPDWLRIGTDIVEGSPAATFNATFSLDGESIVPEPSAAAMFGSGVLVLLASRRFFRRR